MSRALDPPPCAPLQHINGATGTNCPTLDVLESQIASAASRAIGPASTAAAANTANVNNRGQTFRKQTVESGRSRRTKAASLLLCATVNCLSLALATPPSPPDVSFRFRPLHSLFIFSRARPLPLLLTSPATARLPQMPSAAIFLVNLQCRHNKRWYSAHV